MSKELYIIKPENVSDLLDNMIKAAAEQWQPVFLTDPKNLPDLRNKMLLIAIELNEAGYCLPVIEAISSLYTRGNQALQGCSAVIALHSPNDLNTKSTAAKVIFQLNQLGCSFPGHPMIEAIKDLKNFKTWQKTLDLTLEEICLEQCRALGKRLVDFDNAKHKVSKITALHSSSHETSNTLALWRMIADHLCSLDILELNVENGQINDCNGCSFRTCIHYSKQSSCFYGGVMVEEVFPAIEASDAVVWVCPNYNDAVTANLAAVINRLTALYRKTSFHDKALYAVIVSGNSGSDSVAMQIIDALCINKGFYLPPYFCITAIANDPGSIYKVKNIQDTAKAYANSFKCI